ncbi:DUF2796 domain-containing protein [Neptunomonas marina]|uniref:DUF2796 domain-containing protein n=1 Tax=Neptunomonas marina TaxID=1815562 RepID=A0A437Q508_9GAMM|nr:DUF2796 domain-containing protein [Neptunomonas marina]RVU29581.1 DUF2796 domain-containing protein [Neptunomonas marina]
MKTMKQLCVLGSCLLVGFAASAASASDAHEHGIAELNAAFEGKRLDIMFKSPADTIVGFEHEVKNEAQHKQVIAAVQQLRDGYQNILLPDAALCILKHANVEQALVAMSDDHDTHEKHGHEDKHGHDENMAASDDHDHDHDKHQDHGGHSDFMVEYTFECQKPKELNSLQVGLFNHYPALETVRYQAIGISGQKGGEVNSATASISLK